jgi:hypothetical protein
MQTPLFSHKQLDKAHFIILYCPVSAGLERHSTSGAKWQLRKALGIKVIISRRDITTKTIYE